MRRRRRCRSAAAGQRPAEPARHAEAAGRPDADGAGQLAGARSRRPSDVPLEQWKLASTARAATRSRSTGTRSCALPQVDDVSDFHCVTGWWRLDTHWRGVRFADHRRARRADRRRRVRRSAPATTATRPTCRSPEALKDDVLLVHTGDGAAAAARARRPVRMITPKLYAWKGAKWIRRIEFLREDRPGFWEVRGYNIERGR